MHFILPEQRTTYSPNSSSRDCHVSSWSRRKCFARLTARCRLLDSGVEGRSKSLGFAEISSTTKLSAIRARLNLQRGPDFAQGLLGGARSPIEVGPSGRACGLNLLIRTGEKLVRVRQPYSWARMPTLQHGEVLA